MKGIVVSVFIAAAIMSLAGFTRGAVGSTTTDGKTVFVSAKCQTCHSVQSQGIARGSSTATPLPPDLSGTGLRHTAVWIKGFLLKTEMLNGKKHVKKFQGSDDDLNSLSAWLAAQKRR
jgi:cytochrome c553